MAIESAIIQIERHLMSADVRNQFAQVLMEREAPYIRSVILAVEMDAKLQKCTPDSIRKAAMQAATLELSCNPSVKQAYLIAKLKKQKVGTQWQQWWEAEFYPHYLGLYQLAMRSGLYTKIGVIPLPHGYRMKHDLITHQEVVVDGQGNRVQYSPDINPQAAGGWLAYMVAKDGTSKTLFATKEQIHERAKRFPSYSSPGSNWQKADQVSVMEMKTMLRDLLKWADKKGISDENLHKAMKFAEREDAGEVVDGVEVTPSSNAEPVDKMYP